jgi:triphosphoribosyl-dephospho-CoA synthetase
MGMPRPRPTLFEVRKSTNGKWRIVATQVREEFKRRLEKNEVSERHAESLEETLRKLEARFGDTLVSKIRTEDIREWFQSLPLPLLPPTALLGCR